MKKIALYLASFITFNFLTGIQPMEKEFLIQYGKPQAPLKVIEYFSFSCPHCLTIFKDFNRIKEEFIDKNLIYFTFQPVPKDLATVRALHCLQQLNAEEKQIFLEGLFEYFLENKESDANTCKVMQDFMSCFSKTPIPIDQMEYLKQSPIMKKAYDFVSQEEKIKALPTVEINGFMFTEEIPSYHFFAEAVHHVLGEENE